MKKFVPVLLLAIAAPALAQQSHDPVADFMGRFDTNKDGKVTLEEFEAPQQEAIKQQFRYMDKNGDGNLDDDELQALGQMSRPRTQ